MSICITCPWANLSISWGEVHVPIWQHSSRYIGFALWEIHTVQYNWNIWRHGPWLSSLKETGMSQEHSESQICHHQFSYTPLLFRCSALMTSIFAAIRACLCRIAGGAHGRINWSRKHRRYRLKVHFHHTTGAGSISWARSYGSYEWPVQWRSPWGGASQCCKSWQTSQVCWAKTGLGGWPPWNDQRSGVWTDTCMGDGVTSLQQC